MVLQSLRRNLAPLGIYHPNAEALGYELKAYADELERLYTWLDTLLDEGFIQTAEDIGLTVYEELFGPSRDELTPEVRRERLLQRMTLGEGDFTPSGIEKALDSFGLSYTISEFPNLNRLVIAAQTHYSSAEKAFIAQETEKIVPAHLEYQLVFNTLTWAQLDARDRTFRRLDSDNLRWEQIDALE